jgi:hypothetical protein
MKLILFRPILRCLPLAILALGLKSAAAQDKPAPAVPAVLVLDPSEKSWALEVSGKSQVVVQKGDIVVNSSHRSAVWLADSSLTAQAGAIKIVGGLGQMGEGTASPKPQTGTTPVADPIPPLHLSPLAIASNGRLFLSSLIEILKPGVYVGGISSTGQRRVKLEPGIYVIYNGDFFFSNATVIGEGVTIILTGEKPGAFWTIDGTTLNLASPKEGVLKGIVLLSTATEWNKIQMDNTTGSLRGLIYAPGTGAAFLHQSKVTLDRMISANLSVTNGTELTITGSPVELAPQVLQP